MDKLFIVTFTDQESWESPTLVPVRAIDEDTAIDLAAEYLGYDREELEEKVADGQYGYFAQEIIETEIIHYVSSKE